MQKVILDVDTGTDDAIAMMTALLSPELEVLGVCSVNGNRGIDFTTENTLRVVEYLGLQDLSLIHISRSGSAAKVGSLAARRSRRPFSMQLAKIPCLAPEKRMFTASWF